MFVGLLPSLLSLAYPGENPSTVRTGMAIPVTAVLVALPLALALRAVARRWVGGRDGTVAAGARPGRPIWRRSSRINVDQYFRIYARQHTQSSQHSREVARAVNGFLALGGRREDVVHPPLGQLVRHPPGGDPGGGHPLAALLPNVDQAPRADGVPRPRLYVVHPDDRQALALLLRWYPAATLHAHVLPDRDGRPFYVTVFVPPGAVAIRPTGGAGGR